MSTKGTVNEYLLGQIMAQQLATELQVKSFMEIVGALSQQLPGFETIKEQTKEQLLSEIEEMRIVILNEGDNTDAFLKGFNFAVDCFKKSVEGVP